MYRNMLARKERSESFCDPVRSGCRPRAQAVLSAIAARCCTSARVHSTHRSRPGSSPARPSARRRTGRSRCQRRAASLRSRSHSPRPVDRAARISADLAAELKEACKVSLVAPGARRTTAREPRSTTEVSHRVGAGWAGPYPILVSGQGRDWAALRASSA